MWWLECSRLSLCRVQTDCGQGKVSARFPLNINSWYFLHSSKSEREETAIADLPAEFSKRFFRTWKFLHFSFDVCYGYYPTAVQISNATTLYFEASYRFLCIRSRNLTDHSHRKTEKTFYCGTRSYFSQDTLVCFYRFSLTNYSDQRSYPYDWGPNKWVRGLLFLD